MSLIFINLVTPKVCAKCELWFDEPATEASLLNKSSCLAAALGVTKFLKKLPWFWSHFVVFLKSDLDVQQTHLRLCQANPASYLDHIQTKVLVETKLN
jgi:hypothetical protein